MIYRGQNFLVNNNYITKIIEEMNLDKSDKMLEIGCGYGQITEIIANKVAKIIALDIDDNLIQKAGKRLRTQLNVELICEDILLLNISKLDSDYRIFGNIPYYLTNPILKRVIFEYKRFKDIHFTVQKEVGERLTASHGSSNYGIMTVLLKSYVNIEQLLTIPANAFKPIPEVDSELIRITLKAEKLLEWDNWSEFQKFLQGVFHQKRKTLLNNLTHLIQDKSKDEIWINLLKPLGITKKERAEEIRLESLIEIFKKLSNNML
jgi:16S rRNA (adenine1518-N6/adenine1519-N6)-dimethyltransferase